VISPNLHTPCGAVDNPHGADWLYPTWRNLKVQRPAKYAIAAFLATFVSLAVSHAEAASRQYADVAWQQLGVAGFGDKQNTSVLPFVLDGKLFVSTFNSASGTQVIRFSDPFSWTTVITDGFGSSDNRWIGSVESISDTIYVGLENLVSGGEIWRTDDGTQWTHVMTHGFGVPTNTYVIDFEVVSGTLYAGTRNDGGGQVWRSSDGAQWSRVNLGGFGAWNWGVYSLAAFQGRIYAGTGNSFGGSIWRSSNGADWTQGIAGGFNDAGNSTIYRMIVFDDWLYAATHNSATGVEVWRTPNGIDWSQANIDGFGESSNIGARSLFVFGGELHVGLRND